MSNNVSRRGFLRLAGAAGLLGLAGCSGNSGSEAKAVGVAETLGVDAANISENDGSYSTKYDVVVLLGSDLA